MATIGAHLMVPGVGFAIPKHSSSPTADPRYF